MTGKSFATCICIALTVGICAPCLMAQEETQPTVVTPEMEAELLGAFASMKEFINRAQEPDAKEVAPQKERNPKSLHNKICMPHIPMPFSRILAANTLLTSKSKNLTR